MFLLRINGNKTKHDEKQRLCENFFWSVCFLYVHCVPMELSSYASSYVIWVQSLRNTHGLLCVLLCVQLDT